ncbi:hypothetical protein YC2023_038167 [Brassica napus]
MSRAPRNSNPSTDLSGPRPVIPRRNENFRQYQPFSWLTTCLFADVLRLKKKYRNVMSKFDLGKEVFFKSPHDQSTFEISRKILEPNWEDHWVLRQQCNGF